jgi:hypothetical protein
MLNPKKHQQVRVCSPRLTKVVTIAYQLVLLPVQAMDLERMGRMIMTMRGAPGLLANIGSTLIRFLTSLKRRLDKSMCFLKHVLIISNSMFQLIKLTPLILNFISRFFTKCLQ